MEKVEYLNMEEYKSLGLEEIPDLELYLNRANLDIFRLLELTQEEFEELDGRVKFKVKMATADQAVFLGNIGIESSISGGIASSVRIGSYSEGSTAGAKADKSTGYASTIIEWLRGTGLLQMFGSMQEPTWYGDPYV